MRKFTTLASVVVLSIGAVAAVASESSTAPPAWLVLTKAYPLRKNSLIKEYTHSKVKSTRLYARALLDLSERHFSSLAEDGKACYKEDPDNRADAKAYFGCLFAVSTGLGLAQKWKHSFVWRARAISFYKRYSHIINKTKGNRSPRDKKEPNYPDIAAIKKWPEQTVSVKKIWSPVTLNNGTVTAYINGKPVKMLVDTGTTFIALSMKEVKHDGLESALIPLGAKGKTRDFGNGFVSHLYYVKNFRLGPITIANAYILISPNSQSPLPGSKAGINLLSVLKKFTISDSKITPFDGRPASGSTCGYMMFTRRSVMQSFEFPFFEVSTSMGRLGLFLDSGGHWTGVFGEVGVNFPPREKPRLLNTGAIKAEKKNVKRFILQNGKATVTRADIFKVSVSGIQTHGTFSPLGPVGPMVAGAMTFNFLEKAKVAYDFPDRKMCIIPDSQPASAASDKSETQR